MNSPRLERVENAVNHAAESPERASWPEPLADAAYHGLTGDVVRTIEPHSEADPVALGIQFVVYAGACIGRGPYYQVEGDRHSGNLYAVLVGETSKARKGTSQGRVRQLFTMLDDPFADRCIQSGLSSGEGLIWAVRDDTNGEPGVQDKRLLVAESEFAGLLRVMTRDGNIISRIVRDAWDRGDLGVLTKKFSTRATGAHISIVGHITGDELRRYLDRTEAANGFANRFLFAAVKRSKCLPHGGNLKESHLKPLVKRLATVIDHAGHLGRVSMDDTARRLWESVYPDLSEGQPGMYGAVTGRAEAQVIRLALLYALLDEANTIAPDHLRAALAVWDYCDASARYIFGDATGDPVADTIMERLRLTHAGLSRTEISAAFGRNMSASRINTALAMLASAGRVTNELVQTEGRPIEQWYAK